MFLDSIQWFILTILAFLVIIIFWGSLYAFFFAIFQFVFSSGDTEKIKKAWNSIRFMILWIFMTLIFLFIFPIIFRRLEVPGYEAYTARNIFQKSTDLIQAFFLFGWEAVQDYQSWWVLTNPSTITTPNRPASQPSTQPSRELEL
jgi:heme/copper-type cytochrome/quinol oxidase subunit 2